MTKYDIVLYGASGFTGQNVLEYLHRAAVEYSLIWAVAGRDEGRLKAALDKAGSYIGEDLTRTPVILCDSSDPSSLLSMATQAKLVLNCVGPYIFHGEPVVEACVEAGSHHLDVSGEPLYLEKIQLKYHQRALDNGVYVIGACGFDSIPADMGQICVRKAMEGDVNSIETYFKLKIPDLPGPGLNFGTWQSAIHAVANVREALAVRKKLYTEKLPQTKPGLKFRGPIHYSNIVKSWCMPIMETDKTVMRRTVRGFYHDKGQRPTSVACYAQMRSLFSCLLLLIGGLIFSVMAYFSWTRSLLENYPGLFSAGRVSKHGVPREKAENTNFEMTLVGEGWTHRVGLDARSTPPNRVVTTRVQGRNIGYGSTCECIVQCALVILQEPGSLPSAGGVYPPGYALGDTTLVDRLTERGVTFNTVVQEI